MSSKHLVALLAVFTGSVTVQAVEVPLSTTRVLPTNCEKVSEFRKRVGEFWNPHQVFFGDSGYDWVLKFEEPSMVVFNPHGAVEVPTDLFHFSSQVLPSGVKEVVAISPRRPMSVLKRGADATKPAVRIAFTLSRRPTNQYLSGVPAKYIWADTSLRVNETEYANKPDWSNATSQRSTECYDLYVTQ